MAVPASLLIDDGAPVNLMVWHCPWEPHERLVPNAMARNFAGLCDSHGVRGKFSVLPMPAALGRIDRQLTGVSPAHLRGFLKSVRKGIAPNFDITCELLTHLVAYDVRGEHFLHEYEDRWVAHASADEITDTVALAIRILEAVGLKPTGATSPWSTGSTNETAYAKGIGQAFWRTQRRKTAWYFLHCLESPNAAWPWVTWRDNRRGLKTVTVPANTSDVFWATQSSTSLRAARAAARNGVDQLLTANGRTGQIRELIDTQAPVTLLTHWQSLFSNGRMAGLWGLELLLERMSKHVVDEIEWMRCSELAKLARPRPKVSR
ncbi:MAG: hypothetical protein ACYS8X_04570 [Planctomycetota bacterium]|jgi:hypothetical protein